MKKQGRFSLLVLFLGLFSFSCDNESMNDKVDYDRSEFLTNFAENIIIPAFEDYNKKSQELSTAINALVEEKTEGRLLGAQIALKEAWLVYQYVAYLQVGPSADMFFRDEVNIFPADTVSIKQKISNGDLVFTGSTNIDVKGFPALDYLINGVGSSSEDIVAFYNDAEEGAARRAYLIAVTNEIVSMAAAINDQWSSYKETFVSNLGTDIGSSTGIMVNEYNLQFDLRLKNGKIGIPSGVKSLERVNPDKIECLYGGYSKDLALASVEAAISIFNGVSYNGGIDGEGYDDYLDALGAEVNGISLSTAINDALIASKDKIDAIGQDFYAAAQTYNADGDLVSAYNALQAVIPLIKVDMTSAMSVSITFQDNDGD